MTKGEQAKGFNERVYYKNAKIFLKLKRLNLVISKLTIFQHTGATEFSLFYVLCQLSMP